jgi:hypothetical protein
MLYHIRQQNVGVGWKRQAMAADSTCAHIGQAEVTAANSVAGEVEYDDLMRQKIPWTGDCGEPLAPSTEVEYLSMGFIPIYFVSYV